MSEYYVQPNETAGLNCVAAINSSGWFPIVGNVKGVPAPQNQQTTQWVEAPIEMLSGEWAVPRIPEEKLDRAGVPQEDRDQFMAAFGQDIRTLGPEDFPEPPEDE